MTHLALTDTNALYAAVAFAKACRKAGIQPVIGMTVNVQRPSSARCRSHAAGTGPGTSCCSPRTRPGYRSLCRLSTLIQGRPDREAVAEAGLTWEQIAAHREGLICLGGGRQGWIERFLMAAVKRVQRTRSRPGWPVLSTKMRASRSRWTGPRTQAGRRSWPGWPGGWACPLVAVHPVYCLAPEDAPRLRLLGRHPRQPPARCGAGGR